LSPLQAIQPIKLSQLTRQIQQTVQNVFAGQKYWVLADITNYSFQSNQNYHYFELVEKAEGTNNINARIAAAAWGAGNLKIREFERITGQKFKNDINVLLNVAVEYHPVHGLKLTVVDVDVNFTIGVLEQQRQRTLERLLTECSSFIRKTGETYITRNKELNHSAVIQHIAIITSNSSAGLLDFRHTIENNSFNYKFKIDTYFTTIQGEATSTAVYQKLLEIYNTGIRYDAVVIIRGGGSQTDFIIFDQFPLSKIVAKFPIPIITGIGHQKNETIVDLMAHTSTKTPTKAAEFIIAHNRLFEDQILSFQKSILIKSQQLFSFHFQALSKLNSIIVNSARSNLNHHKDQIVKVNQVTINTTKSILYLKHRDIVNLSNQILSKPKIIVTTKLNDLDNVIKNVTSYCRINFINQRSYIGHYTSIIKLMTPENILRKGFAIIKSNGRIVSDADTIKVGSDISVILSNKEITSTVKSKNDYNGNDFKL
jgi:exodeoxyribonuclease VII large subunit